MLLLFTWVHALSTNMNYDTAASHVLGSCHVLRIYRQLMKNPNWIQNYVYIHFIYKYKLIILAETFLHIISGCFYDYRKTLSASF